MSNRVNVVYLPERLDRITQALLAEGFQTLKIGKRQAAEGPDCFVLGKMATDDSQAVEKAVKQASERVGFVVENVKAGRAGESAPWQADFTVTNLFESEEEDMGTFVDAAIKATPQLQTRIFISDLTKELQAAGLSLYGRLSYKTDLDYKAIVPEGKVPLLLNVYLNSYVGDQAVLRDWASSKIREALTKLGRPPMRLAHWRGVPQDMIVKGHDQITIWLFMIVEGFEPLEGDWLRESEEEDIDTMLGIGERERLYAVMRWLSQNVDDTLWGYVEPAREDSERAPGTTYMRIRLKGNAVSSALRVVKHIYSTGIIEPLNDPANPMEPDLHYATVDFDNGLYDIDMFLAPTGKPLTQRIYAVSDAIEKYRGQPNVEPPDGIIEELDPDTEMWVRHVVEQTPGYKDKERLKAALKALTDAGFVVVWAIQYAAPPGTDDADVVIQVCIRHQPPSPTSTILPVHERDRIAQVLKAYWADVKGVGFDYQDQENGIWRTFSWKWLSHDSPENQTSFTLRAPNWDIESRNMLRDIEHLLIMEADPPMENEPDMDQFITGALNQADPAWQDRLRIDKLARAMEEQSLAGTIAQSITSIPAGTIAQSVGSYTPFVQIRVWLAQEMPEDEDFLPAVTVRNALRKAMLASGIWSAEHIEQALKHPSFAPTAAREGNGQHGSQVFILTTSYKPLIAHGDTIKMKFGESELRPIIELVQETQGDLPPEPEPSPEELRILRQVTRKAINTPEDVIIRSFQNVKDVLKDMGKTGSMDLGAEYKSGQKTYVQCQMIIDVGLTNPKDMVEIIRKALLDGGLKRYYPRRVLHFEWPDVHISNGGHPLYGAATTAYQFVVEFHVNKFIDELYFTWPSIQEARPKGDPDAKMMRQLTLQTMRRVYPDMVDQERLQALAADLRARGFKGSVRIEVDYATLVRLGRTALPRCVVTGDLILPGGDAHAEDEVRHILIELMAKHGFGVYKEDQWYRQLRVTPKYNQDGVYYIDFSAPQANATTWDISDVKVPIEEAQEEIDPEAFLRQSEVGTIWDNRARVLDLAAFLEKAGYWGYLDVVEPERRGADYATVSGRLVQANQSVAVDDNALRGLIAQFTAYSMPGWDDLPMHIKSSAITVRYRTFSEYMPWAPESAWPYYLFVEFFIPIGQWKEDGNLRVELPGGGLSVNVQI